MGKSRSGPNDQGRPRAADQGPKQCAPDRTSGLSSHVEGQTDACRADLKLTGRAIDSSEVGRLRYAHQLHGSDTVHEASRGRTEQHMVRVRA